MARDKEWVEEQIAAAERQGNDGRDQVIEGGLGAGLAVATGLLTSVVTTPLGGPLPLAAAGLASFAVGKLTDTARTFVDGVTNVAGAAQRTEDLRDFAKCELKIDL